MIRTAVALALASGIAVGARAQELSPAPDAAGRWGYLDTTGAWAIAPRFAAARPFAGGLAAAREGGLYGYVDPTGGYVVEPQFDYAQDFRGDYAVVYEGSQPRVIDRGGQPLHDAPLPPGHYRVVSTEGHVAREVEYVPAGVEFTWPVVDPEGRVLVDSPTNIIELDTLIRAASLLAERRHPLFGMWSARQERDEVFADGTVGTARGGTIGVVDHDGTFLAAPRPRLGAGGFADESPWPGYEFATRYGSLVELTEAAEALTSWERVFLWDLRKPETVAGPFDHLWIRDAGEALVPARRGDSLGYVDPGGRWRYLVPQRSAPHDIDYLDRWTWRLVDGPRAEEAERAREAAVSDPTEDTPFPPRFLKKWHPLPGALTQKPLPGDTLQFVLTGIATDSSSLGVALANPSGDTAFVRNWPCEPEVYLEAFDQASSRWRTVSDSRQTDVVCVDALVLPPGGAWVLQVRRYSGTMPTRFRLRIDGVLQDIGVRAAYESIQRDFRAERTLYSPSWTGAVNPAQFWRRRDYDEWHPLER